MPETTPSTSHPIVIVGAGAIGGYLGTIWAYYGLDILFLARAQMRATIEADGLSTTDGHHLSPTSAADDPAVLSRASLIVLCVKSHALPAVMDDLERHAPPQTPILCLLNGLSPLRDLRARFPDRQILAGMVPFNVIWRPNGQLHRSSVGKVMADKHPALDPLTDALIASPSPVVQTTDMGAVQAGKLLLNLNNPINALSGLPLMAQLKIRPFREVYARTLEEALTVYAAANITHRKSGPLPASAIVKVLRMPNWLFNSIALRLQKLDATSTTSMAQDLSAGKPTEIDSLNGEIIRLAAQTGTPTPVNTALIALIKQAEQNGLTALSGAELLDHITRST